MKDYHITVTVRNGRIIEAMRECGYDTVAALSRASGVSQGTIGELVNFKARATNKALQYRESVKKLCAALACSPSDLFPEHLDVEFPTNRIAKFSDSRQLAGDFPKMLGPAEEAEEADDEAALRKIIAALPEQERIVAANRILRGLTYDEIAPLVPERHGGLQYRRPGAPRQVLSAKRAHQIMKKALPKIMSEARKMGIGVSQTVLYGE